MIQVEQKEEHQCVEMKHIEKEHELREKELKELKEKYKDNEKLITSLNIQIEDLNNDKEFL